jgi:apolipoprotein N-acyltransferase
LSKISKLKDLISCKDFFIGILIFFTTAPIYFVIAGLLVLSYFFHFNFYIQELRQKLIKGFSFGVGFFLANFYWMTFSMLVDFSTYWLFFFLSIFAIPIYFCVCYLLPQIYLLHIIKKRLRLSKLKFYFLAVILWFVFEIIRSSSLILIDFQGFSWGVFGYHFFVNDNMAQIFSITGVYIASLLITFLYGLVFLCVDKDFKLSNYKTILSCTFVIIACLLPIYYYGHLRLKSGDDISNEFKYLIVHPAITEHHNFKYRNALNNLDKQIDLIQGSSDYYDIIVLPEGGINFPVNIKDDLSVFKYISDNVANYNYLFSGATRIDGDKYYNSFFVTNNKAMLVDYYDKRYLVPFGEYVPYFKIFDLPLTNNLSGFSFGKLKSIKIGNSNINFKPQICYDALYSNSTLTNDFDFIVNISNDIWFTQRIGGFEILSAAYQHLDIVRARAIEASVPVLRSTNLGFSAVLDPKGRVVKKLNPYNSGVIEGVLKYGNSGQTIYEKIMSYF